MHLLPLGPEPTATTLERIYGKPCITITFQVTEDCCMACTYCYQHNKTTCAMDWTIAKKTIDTILALPTKDEYQTVIYEFIGGEPFMEVSLIHKICSYTIQEMIKLNHPWLPYVRFSLCTNGLLYFTPQVQKFLQEFSEYLYVTFSIDGNKELHDACRVDKNNNPTYDRVLMAIQDYRKNYGILNQTKMTVSPDNVNFLSTALITLIQNDFTEISVNCIFEKGWEYSHATTLYKELKIVGDYLIDYNLYDKVYIRFFQEELYTPLPEDENTNSCGGVIKADDDIHTYVSIDYKGDIYPCIRYMNSSLNGRQKPLVIGNIYNGYGITEDQKENIALLSNITRRSQSTDECFYCPIARGCMWCSGYNYEEFGTPNKRATYICCVHKAASLANVYFLNKLYKQLNIQNTFKMYLPKEEALQIISEDEYNFLRELSIQEGK